MWSQKSYKHKILGGSTERDAQTQIHREQGDLLSLVLFFQNKDIKLKVVTLPELFSDENIY
jgi:hypothetical protein